MLLINDSKECEREKRAAKFEPRSTEWCPSLIRQDTTRVIQVSEKLIRKIEASARVQYRTTKVTQKGILSDTIHE